MLKVDVVVADIEHGVQSLSWPDQAVSPIEPLADPNDRFRPVVSRISAPAHPQRRGQ